MLRKNKLNSNYKWRRIAFKLNSMKKVFIVLEFHQNSLSYNRMYLLIKSMLEKPISLKL